VITIRSTYVFPQFFPQSALYRHVSPSAFIERLAKIYKKILKIVSEKGQNREHFETDRAQSKYVNNYNTHDSMQTIDIDGLCKLLNLSRSATYQLMHEPTFPQAYGVTSRHFLWNLKEVEDWLISRKGVKPQVRRVKKSAKRILIIDGVRLEKAGA